MIVVVLIGDARVYHALLSSRNSLAALALYTNQTLLLIVEHVVLRKRFLADM